MLQFTSLMCGHSFEATKHIFKFCNRAQREGCQGGIISISPLLLSDSTTLKRKLLFHIQH